jgi:hypothetical protein
MDLHFLIYFSYWRRRQSTAGRSRVAPRFADVSDSDLTQRAADFALHLTNAIDEKILDDHVRGTDCDCKQCQRFWAECKGADAAEAEGVARTEAWAAATVEEYEQAAAKLAAV